MWHEKLKNILLKIGFLKGWNIFLAWFCEYEAPWGNFLETSEACLKANNHNTVWNIAKSYSVTFCLFFRISTLQTKKLIVCFHHVTFSVLKSNASKRKYNNFIHFGHIILISKLQKWGRHKRHTVTFMGFFLPYSIVLLCGVQIPPC